MTMIFHESAAELPFADTEPLDRARCPPRRLRSVSPYGAFLPAVLVAICIVLSAIVAALL